MSVQNSIQPRVAIRDIATTRSEAYNIAQHWYTLLPILYMTLLNDVYYTVSHMQLLPSVMKQAVVGLSIIPTEVHL